MAYAVEHERRLYLRDPIGLLENWAKKYPGPQQQLNTPWPAFLPHGDILIKAFALDERQNPKDAYDIVFVRRNYPQDIETLAGRVRPLLSNPLACEGYEILKAKFAKLGSAFVDFPCDTPASQPPAHVASQSTTVNPGTLA